LATSKLLQRKVLLVILVSKKFSCGPEIPRRMCSVNAFTVMNDTHRPQFAISRPCETAKSWRPLDADESH
jgi:hypothetical protein